MAETVKVIDGSGGQRPAARTRRDVAAEATERAIVEAALLLFGERGYVATTMEDLAVEAGVALQTIYNSIGGKRAVLSRAIDLTAAGPQAPRRVPEFMAQRTAAATDPMQVATMLADWFVEVNERMVDVWEIMGMAASIDEGVAELERERASQRYRNYQGAAAAIARLGGLGGLAEEEAAAAIWTLGQPGVRRFLVVDEGWSTERYRAWLVVALTRILAPKP